MDEIQELKNRIEYLENRLGYRYVPRNPSVEVASDIIRRDITFDDIMNRVDTKSLQRIFNELSNGFLGQIMFSLETQEQLDTIRKAISVRRFEGIPLH